MSAFSVRVEHFNAWIVVTLGERVDSFNFGELKRNLDSLPPGAFVALDLQQTRFMSIPMIHYVSDLATRLMENRGRLAFLAVGEKLKHQIGLFASLDKVLTVRRLEQLPQVGSTSGSPQPDGISGF